jgi:hypothetical protein
MPGLHCILKCTPFRSSHSSLLSLLTIHCIILLHAMILSSSLSYFTSKSQSKSFLSSLYLCYIKINMSTSTSTSTRITRSSKRTAEALAPEAPPDAVLVKAKKVIKTTTKVQKTLAPVPAKRSKPSPSVGGNSSSGSVGKKDSVVVTIEHCKS